MYILVYGFLFLCFIFEELTKNAKSYQRFIISICAITPVFFLAALRWKTGNDWNAYFNFYINAQDLSYHSISYELGFRTLVQFCKLLGFDYTGFLIIVTLLQLSGFYFLFQKTKSPSLCILFFFSTYFLGYIATIRQTIAISLCLIGLVRHLDKKNRSAVFWFLLAFFFHYSSLIFFTVYFVPKKMKTLAFYSIYLIVVVFFSTYVIPPLLDYIFLGFSKVPLISKLYDYYTVKSDLGDQASLLYIWYLKRIIMVSIFYTLVRFFIPERAYYFNLYLLGVTLFFVFINVIPMLGLRAAEYFNVFEMILLALAISSIRANILIKIFIVFIISAPRLYSTIYNYHPELYVPYYSIFEKNQATRQMY
ncbi:EpsG family protein [Vibrio parahaemolyticus]|uniref:EpsG family protein n=1 Tax=Vibrio parahaemolyticus TaxID=670 RepID=UPI0009B6570B|nr:EpsG family protein [Vibrio parahaemolyticus]EHJ9992226.1 EpsG family protein [Vibrio parahaemolyticus]MCG0008413.1 EpsG family protein [Vibrio parahaemolyticus]MCG0013172.1 EpsG family protein [Vibrio parahaemolyticus]MDL1999103.1 EpsG family protein [Vibrio parahaemolyticus]MDL2021044.1 EpsG family protein [Vibrio parahaemolyticus]